MFFICFNLFISLIMKIFLNRIYLDFFRIIHNINQFNNIFIQKLTVKFDDFYF